MKRNGIVECLGWGMDTVYRWISASNDCPWNAPKCP